MAYKPKPMRYKADGTPDMRGRKPSKPMRERNPALLPDVIADSESEKKAIIRHTIQHLMELYKQPRVKNDDELLERIGWYFDRCDIQGLRPTVEGLGLATGYDDRTLWDWETGRNKGFSPYTSDIIKKTKRIIASFDAQMVADGKMNPVAYIFRAKNYYHMTNKQEVVVTPNVNPTSSPEELIQAAQALPEE